MVHSEHADTLVILTLSMLTHAGYNVTHVDGGGVCRVFPTEKELVWL
jgi:hypothetical protein